MTSRKRITTTTFGRVPEWVLVANVPHGAIRLYGYLSMKANDRDEVWRGVDSLAKLFNVTARTIQNWLRALEAIGALQARGKSNLGTTKYAVQYQPPGGETNFTPGVNLVSPEEDQVKKTKIEEDQDVGVKPVSPPSSNGGIDRKKTGERFFDCKHTDHQKNCKSCLDKLLAAMKKQADREERRWARLHEQGF
jgi:hypothetical protein